MQHRLDHWRGVSARMLRQHSVFLGICIVYVVVGYLYIQHFGDGTGRELSYTSYFFMRMMWPIIAIGAGLFIVREAIVERPEKLTLHCWTKMRERYLTLPSRTSRFSFPW
jgi:hypothetical protein